MYRQGQPQSDPPHFLADEKIRIVLDGLRGEGSLASCVLTKATNRLSFDAEDCRGQPTAEGHTAIESFRKDVSTRAILDARVDAWRKQLRTTNQERKCSNVSRYRTGSYVREFIVQRDR